MDAFYASIEQRDDPSLRGRPVVVGGSPEGRGVVAAASYEARRFGIRSAMPSGRALRLCPEIVFVRPDFTRYQAVSAQLMAILRDYTDLVEPLSLDEAYLDVALNRRGLPTATATAREIKARVREELRLTCSAGVAPVKFVAKIASDFRKPDGLTVVPPERVLGFVHPLPIEKLWGVGPATAERLHALGIRRIGDVAARSEAELAEALGRLGRWLWRLAHGDDPREVTPHRERKSRGAEETFARDLVDRQEVIDTFREQAEEVAAGLRRADQRARTVTIKVRYDDFTTITRSETLAAPTADASALLESAIRLLDRTDAGTRPVRLAGLSAQNLVGSVIPGEQLRLPFGS